MISTVFYCFYALAMGHLGQRKTQLWGDDLTFPEYQENLVGAPP